MRGKGYQRAFMSTLVRRHALRKISEMLHGMHGLQSGQIVSVAVASAFRHDGQLYKS